MVLRQTFSVKTAAASFYLSNPLRRVRPASLRTVSTSGVPHIYENGMSRDDAYTYTSGKWIYNEAKRLKERRLLFDIPALADAAANAVGREVTDVQSITKVAEGGFNRVFQLTLDDGLEIIARLPYPVSGPKCYSVASEVATMDLVRNHGVPTPQVFGYCCDADNAVGAEYILMEKLPGRPLGDIWFSLQPKERVKVVSEIVANEAKLFAIDLQANGSLFYEHDLPSHFGRHKISSSRCQQQLCVGPDVSLEMWWQKRADLEIHRGPSMSALDAMTNAAIKELAWLERHGKPRLPSERYYRDITKYQTSDPLEHMHNIKSFTRIARYLVPKEDWLCRPTIRHPDLSPNNIFVSPSLEITGILDWQHSNILPLFLHAGIPSHLQNHGDPVSDTLSRPHLPHNFEELEQEDKENDLELFRKRHVHFFYIAATAKKLNVHYQAMAKEGEMLRRRIYQHAGHPWEGNNVPLAADLVQVSRHWPTIISQSDEADKPVFCPLDLDEKASNEAIEMIKKQEEADEQMKMLRNFLGVSNEGWTSNDNFEAAAAQAAQWKMEAIEAAEDEDELQEIEHYPFEDHDEDE